MNKKPNIIFLHLSKTAGSSLRTSLALNYNPKNRLEVYVPPGTVKPQPHSKNSILHYVKNNYSADRLSKVEFFSAHCFYGIHKVFNQDFKYITMMRNPVDRIISHYYFSIKTNPNVANAYSTLEEYVESNTNQHNWMTKMISGTWDGDLSLAKKNITENIAFCGITEMYKESLELMSTMFNLSLRNEVRNANKNKKPLSEINPKTIERIRQLQNKDIELYRFAKNKLKNL